jgi:hypothetical protein
MSELDRIWNSNTPALLAADIIADARKKAETHRGSGFTFSLLRNVRVNICRRADVAVPQEALRQLEPSSPSFHNTSGSVTKCMKARSTFDPWDTKTIKRRIESITAENVRGEGCSTTQLTNLTSAWPSLNVAETLNCGPGGSAEDV